MDKGPALAYHKGNIVNEMQIALMSQHLPFTRSDFEAAAAFIANRTPLQPKIALILGSGLGPLADSIENPTRIPYHEIPKFPTSSVQGHAGRLVIGHLEGQAVMVMQGRTHFYEGIDPRLIEFPIRVMQVMGVQTLIVTNAAGGINQNYRMGDLMLIRDHIGLAALAGHNPLMGPNDDSFGPRFTPMTRIYEKHLRQLALKVAAEEGITLHQGVYCSVSGPMFESPAEIRMIRSWGADAVGMSTVPEVMVAKHGGMEVLGISSITNMCIDDEESDAILNHEEVLEVGMTIVPNLTRLLRGVLRDWEA